MKLCTLDLSEYGPHEKLHLEFAPGLNCICGKNGSGKSTAVSAIKGSLSGAWDHPDGARGIIRRLAEEKLARVAITLQMEDQSYANITRVIGETSTKHYLTFKEDGEDRRVQKASDIKLWLEQTLKLTTDVINNYMFIPQGELYKFLDATPAVRVSNFSQLCGTSIVEKCRQPIKKLIAVEEHSITINSLADIEQRKVQYEDCLSSIDTLTKNIEALDVQIKALPDTSKLMTLQRDLIEATTATSTVATIRQRLTKYAADLTELNSRFEEANSDYIRQSTFVDDYADKYKEALILLDKNNNDVAILTARNNYIKNIEGAKRELVALPIPTLEKAAEGFNIGDVTLKLQLASNELMTKMKLSENASKLSHASVCPVCGSATEHWKVDPVKLKDDIDKLNGEISELERIKSFLDSYTFNMQQFTFKQRSYTAKIQSFETALAGLPEVFSGNDDAVEDARQLIVAYTSAQAASQDRQDQLARYSTLIESTNVSVKENTAEYERALAISNKEAGIREAVKHLETQHREFLKLESQKNDCLSQIKLLTKQKNEHETWIEQQNARIAAFERQKEFINILERTSDVLSPKCLPNIIHQRVLFSMLERINAELQELEAEFSVSCNSDLSFTANFHIGPNRGTEITAAALSGGQKTLLSLAYWLSIQSMFARSIGIMFLDEPCSFLDKNNRDKLVEVFLKLRERLHARNQQMIVVSHEESLWPAFDKVHKIGE